MFLMRKRKFIRRVSLNIAQVCLFVFLIVFVLIPLVFRYSISFQRNVLFLTFITYPKNLDLARPQTVGLHATRNFHIHVKDMEVEEKAGIKIGLWHVLPLHMMKAFTMELQLEEEARVELQNVTAIKDDEHLKNMEATIKKEYPVVDAHNEGSFYETLLKIKGTVVLYLHGNTASRGSGHRIEVYKLLRKLGYHVIAMDYRGYGDSDPVTPTEEGVVQDAIAVYQYITNVTSNPVFVWGHSLGTGVATSLCSQLAFYNRKEPRGVILESPFTSISDEIRKHPFAKLFKHLPWFDMTFVRPMYSNQLRFESDQHIGEFPQPVMIIHAEDDYVVPFQLGYRLYRIALDTRGKAWGPVEFHRFDAALKYGHKYLCRAPELPELVKRFIDNYRNAVY